MKVAVIGGGLQGVEICLLAKKAGWKTLLIDQSENPIAKELADDFLCMPVEELAQFSAKRLQEIFLDIAILIPALENDHALQFLVHFCKQHALAFAFDEKAYAISSSKIKSQRFFEENNTPIPKPAKNTDTIPYPLIAKPSKGSGSQGVRLLHNEQELLAYLPEGLKSSGWIIESYCAGRQFSMEVCGTPEKYQTFQLTELLMDDVFDCRGVVAPVKEKEIENLVQKELLKLAERLQLQGIMDIEVAADEQGIHVFEIDARFPSQTPLTVYYSTGVNLLEHFVACFINYTPQAQTKNVQSASYFHVAREGEKIFYAGEHSLTTAGSLRLMQSVPGAEEVLIGGSLEEKKWSAVLFLAAENDKELEKRKAQALQYLTQ